MKKIYSVICSPALIILLFVTPVIGSSDWIKYWKDEGGNVIFYNKGSIKKDAEKGIVEVMEKIVYSEKQKQEVIQTVREKGMLDESWDKLQYQEHSVVVDCKNKKRQVLSIAMYDSYGDRLFSRSLDNPKWQDIVPDSIGDYLRIKFCK